MYMPYSNYAMHCTGTCNGHLLNGTQIWENFVNWGGCCETESVPLQVGYPFLVRVKMFS